MSICEDRITEDSTEFEKAFLKIYDGSLWTALDKMKDWQAPKPLVVVPQFVADWFDINQDGIDGNIKALVINIYRNPKSGWSEMDDWFMYSPNKPIETLISMKLDGYTVEKEQLYEVRLPIPDSDIENDYALIDISGNIWEDAFPTKYKLTEQEIKAIDSRYMVFAVKVEG